MNQTYAGAFLDPEVGTSRNKKRTLNLITHLRVHLRAHDLPDLLFLDLLTVRFLQNNPRPNHFTESGIGN